MTLIGACTLKASNLIFGPPLEAFIATVRLCFVPENVQVLDGLRAVSVVKKSAFKLTGNSSFNQCKASLERLESVTLSIGFPARTDLMAWQIS